MTKETVGLRKTEVIRKIRKISEETSVNNKILELKKLDSEFFKINNIILPEKRINVFCGCNGAGKTTVAQAILSCLKGEIEESIIKNDGNTKLRREISRDIKYFIFDSHTTSRVKDYLKQDEIQDILDEISFTKLDESQLKILNHMSNREYDEISVGEIEKINIIEDIKPYCIKDCLPYFKVKFSGKEYESPSMGMGEHLIFFMYFLLKDMDKDTSIILEEPENYLSPVCQERFMDYLLNIIFVKKYIVYLTTHSPHILHNIPKDLINVLVNIDGKINVIESETTDSALSSLGLTLEKEGLFLLEDYVGLEFLKYILKTNSMANIIKKYEFIVVGGEGNIENALKYIVPSKSFKVFGVFDGDINGKIEPKENYLFLPERESIENIAKSTIKDNIPHFSKSFSIKECSLTLILSKLHGKEPHEWLEEIIRELNLDKITFLSEIFKFISTKENYINDVSDIKKKLDKI